MLLLWWGCAGEGKTPATDDSGSTGADDTAAPLIPGDDCGEEPWGDIPDGPGTVWVRAGESGDGTRDAPFGTIDEAIAAIGGDGTIAIGEGRYPGVTVEGALTVIGRCTGLVHIEGGVEPGVQIAEGASAELRNLAVTDGSVGVQLDGGRLEAYGLVVDGVPGDGLVANGGEASISWSTWTDIGGRGIVAAGASVALTEEVRVFGSVHGGLVAKEGGRIDGFRVYVEEAVGVGLVAAGEGSRITLSDSYTDGTLRDDPPWMGSGAVAFDGGAIDFSTGGIRQASGPLLGLYEGGSFQCEACSLTDGYFSVVVVAGGSLTLTDAQVTGGFPDSQLGGGMTVYATDGYGENQVTMSNCEVDLAPHAALWFDGPGAYQVSDSTILGVLGYDINASGTGGNAVFLEDLDRWDGATGASFTGNLIQNAPNVAVMLENAAATFSGTTWNGNNTDLRQQRCTDVEPLADAELDGANAVVCPDGDRPVDHVVLDPRLIPTAADI